MREAAGGRRGTTPASGLALLGVLALLPLGASAGTAGGLPPAALPFRSYGTEQGLRNLAATFAVQDQTGFLWLATQDGAYRYDGQRFVRFGLEDGLPSNYVTALAAGAADEVWVGTTRGLARRAGAGFRTVAEVGRAYVNGVALDGQGRLWVATREGLYWSGAGGFEPVPGWPDGEASAVLAGRRPDGPILAARGATLGRRATSGRWAFERLPLDPATTRVEALAEDRSGRVWVRTLQHLLWQARGGGGFRDESAHVAPIGNRGYLSVDRRGDLWVPSDDGLFRWDGAAWSRLGPADGLPTRWSRGVLEDREGSLWVTSRGVHRLLGRGQWSSWTERHGLPSEIIWSLLRDRAGRLWCGTGRGLARATPDGWRLVPGTERHALRSVVEAPDGRLWMGGSPAEILSLDPRTGALTHFGPGRGVAGRRILGLRVERNGTIWAATDGAGLLARPPSSPRFERVRVPDDFAGERFSYVLADSSGRLWATGERGLLLRESGKWRRLTTREGLRSNDVSYVAERGGELWIAYFEALGVSHARQVGGEFKVVEHLDEGSGLGSAKTYLLGHDVGGRLWVGSGNGIDLLSRAGLVHFGTGDGLVGDDCDSMAFLAEPDGSVLIGTSSGLSRFRPAPDAPLAPPPATHLMSVAFGGEPLGPGSQSPSVPRARGTLEVEFAGLSFVDESRVNYEVRLLGLEPAWRPSRVREVRFPSLPAGSYRFEARARFGSGPWGAPATLAFEVLPWWWETPLARLGGLGLLMGLAYAGVRLRLKTIERHNRELGRRVAERTRELAEANAALAELSLRDPLTGLNNRRSLLEWMSREAAHLARLTGASPPAAPDAAREIVFLMVDLDHFKLVNDRHGHAVGDLVLAEFAELVRRHLRESDEVVRWGGEEFLVVARSCTRVHAGALAERIRQSVAEHVFGQARGLALRQTCSLGLAPHPFAHELPGLLGWEQALELADLCLYEAKRAGRNAWLGARPRPGVAASDLASAVAQGPGALLRSALIELERGPAVAGPASF